MDALSGSLEYETLFALRQEIAAHVFEIHGGIRKSLTEARVNAYKAEQWAQYSEYIDHMQQTF